MKVERMDIKACCGATSTAFKLDAPLSKDILPLLVGKGFIEAKHFTKAGMLYAENDSVIVNGPFGSNIVHIKCKNDNCVESLNSFEQLLTSMG